MKKYLIIGGSNGIGKTLIDRLLSDGHVVYASYNKHQIEDERVNKFFFDVTKEDQIEKSILPETIDGLAYMPGSINLKPFSRIKVEEFLTDYNLQVLGAIKVIQSLLPMLKAADKPSIVLCSTVAVQCGFPFHSIVSSSKGAIEGLTRALAAEFAPHIRVNAVAPSLTNTSLAGTILNTNEKIESNAARHPLKQIGEPIDIANAIKYLLGEESKWMSGQVLHVDGGMSSLKL